MLWWVRRSKFVFFSKFDFFSKSDFFSKFDFFETFFRSTRSNQCYAHTEAFYCCRCERTRATKLSLPSCRPISICHETDKIEKKRTLGGCHMHFTISRDLVMTYTWTDSRDVGEVISKHREIKIKVLD